MLKDLFRLIKILHIFLKARVDSDLEEFNLPKLIRLFLLISPWKLYSAKEPRGKKTKEKPWKNQVLFL